MTGVFVALLIIVCIAAVRIWLPDKIVNEDTEGNIVSDTGITENMSLEETLAYLRPTAVQLYHATEGGGYTAASGFLIEMTEDRLYICTNRHVIWDYDDWDVFFYEGTKACGRKTGVSGRYDVGVVEVENSQLTDELLRNLMTVHIDLEYWEQLGTKEVDIGLLRVGQNGDILYTTEGKLLRKETEFLWGDGEKETELKIEQNDGDSGSAVFDRQGNLVSMVFGISHDAGGDRNWGIPLRAIVESYQEITGRDLS